MDFDSVTIDIINGTEYICVIMMKKMLPSLMVQPNLGVGFSGLILFTQPLKKKGSLILQSIQNCPNLPDSPQNTEYSVGYGVLIYNFSDINPVHIKRLGGGMKN